MRKIASFISSRQLLSAGESYLIALSGGADSVCLLRVLAALGYSLRAAHCNFQLRPEEADRDEEFCKRLCDSMKVPLSIAHFDTSACARQRKISIEMAARELRYAFFLRLAKENNLSGVCVAHHKNDSVETLLLNLLRGTGPEGLKGIAPKNGIILRPLLAVSRKEIEEYLADIGQKYVTDSTNLIPDVKRNIVRLRLMPLLRELNPAADENIYNASLYVADNIQLAKTAIASEIKRVSARRGDCLSISIAELLRSPAPETILRELLKDKGFTSFQAEEIYRNLSAQTGKHWSSVSHIALINRGELLVAPAQDGEESAPFAGGNAPVGEDKPLSIPAKGEYIYNKVCRLSVKEVPVDGAFQIIKEPGSASLDAGKIEFPLSVRRIRTGDRFVPFGMNGGKLVSDYLTSCRVSLFERRQQLVLTDRNGNILWLIGKRTDNRFRISAASARALIVSLLPLSSPASADKGNGD